jgi:type IV pilus assembly protein PilC
MARAGVPLPDAMQVTADATNNIVYQEALATAREAMLRGEGLAAPIAATGLFPAAARQMLRAGEDTGTLDDQLEGAAEYFERELDYKITRFTSLFEPAVIVMMGVVVGFVAIALVSAMYGIFRSVEL